MWIATLKRITQDNSQTDSVWVDVEYSDGDKKMFTKTLKLSASNIHTIDDFRAITDRECSDLDAQDKLTSMLETMTNKPINDETVASAKEALKPDAKTETPVE